MGLWCPAFPERGPPAAPVAWELAASEAAEAEAEGDGCGPSQVTCYLTQEGLQVIPVQNWLMNSRIVPRLEPRTGRRSSHLLHPCRAHPHSSRTPYRGSSSVRARAVGCCALLQAGPQELNSNTRLWRQSGRGRARGCLARSLPPLWGKDQLEGTLSPMGNVRPRQERAWSHSHPSATQQACGANRAPEGRGPELGTWHTPPGSQARRSEAMLSGTTCNRPVCSSDQPNLGTFSSP